MNQKLTLNDGTVLENAHAIVAVNVLWVYIDIGITMTEAFELLNDPEKTAIIRADDFGAESVYSGYTDLYCIKREENGQINAGLKKAVG